MSSSENDEASTLKVRGTLAGGRKGHLDPGTFEAVVHNDEASTLKVRGTPPGGRKGHLDPGTFEEVVHKDPESGQVSYSGWKVPWMLNEQRRRRNRKRGYMVTISGVIIGPLTILIMIIISYRLNSS